MGKATTSGPEAAVTRLSIMPGVRKAALAVLLFAPSASAENPDEMIERGIQLREQGKDDEALGWFKRAYQASPTPRALAQIALAEQALGQWVPAERDLNDALAKASDDWIAKHKTALSGALATIQQHIGDLVLNGGVEGAQVSVDGAKVGTLPAPKPIRLEIGTHTLEIQHASYYPISQPVTIRADAPARVHVDMHPRTQDGSNNVVTTTTTVPPPVTNPPPSSSSPQQTIGIVVAASAGLPLILGIIGIAAHESSVADYNGDPTCPGKEVPVKPPACQSRVDTASTWSAVSVASFVGAGVLAATGVILLLTAPRSKAIAFDANGLRVSF
jgi:hypothetical protein